MHEQKYLNNTWVTFSIISSSGKQKIEIPHHKQGFSPNLFEEKPFKLFI